jgi:hypothetical protein
MIVQPDHRHRRLVPGNVSNVSGRHAIFRTFSSGRPDGFVNVNWIQFRR